MSLKVTILGCGSSGGVPRIGGDWGKCDPNNPRNRRRRCAILVQQKGTDGVTHVLVDTPPDLREQLLDVGVGWVDGVLYTHEHADHIHGIDDLRVVAFNGRARVDVYMAERMWDRILPRFSYCFESPPGSPYPPILNAREIRAGEPLTITGAGGPITVLPFLQQHGSITSLGFRFGDLAYSTDVNHIPDESLPALANLKVWIVDALRRTPHPTHFSLPDALAWIERIKPERAILTNLHTDMDYETLRRELPEGVEPAYDGLEIVL